MVLVIALAMAFSATALAGLTSRDLETRRSRLKSMFGVGCVIYVILVGLTVSSLWLKNLDDLPALLTSVMLIWGMPLASSGFAVLAFWSPEQTAPEPLEIGFSRN